MTTQHISICICTYKRPWLLKRLLDELRDQQTDGLFTYSIVVVDNDRLQSAEQTVADFEATSKVPIKYCVEPQQNIAMARNRAVANATGDFFAFIDDDEFPVREWLCTHLKALQEFGTDGVLGPVRPHFDKAPPKWLVKGGYHDRPEHRTGLALDWTMCRTGNVLLQSGLFSQEAPPFRPECLSGEDQDFFKRQMATGRTFIWCNEAVVYEVVPPERWKRSFLVRRGLFRGVFSLRNHGFPPLRILQSAIAVPLYMAALPVALLLGQARFMKYVYQLSYHLGRLFAVAGVNPVRGPYVT